jgi:peroxiredoxin
MSTPSLNASCRALALVILLAGSARGAEDTEPGKAPEAVPDRLPPLTVAEWVNTAPVPPAELEGKVVLVHFFGVVNGPSRKLLPLLERLYQEHRADGLRVIGITLDKPPHAQGLAKRLDIAHPLATDQSTATHDAYGVEFLPTIWLVDRTGRFLWRGYAEEFTRDRVLQALKPPAPPTER